jgi:predicted Zn-dependent protease
MRQREAWEIDLDRHLAEEERQTKQEEAIQQQADYLVEKGQDYYPFDYGNFGEALAEMPNGAKMALCAIAQVASEEPDNNHVHSMVATALLSYVREYWEGLALREAETYIKED